MVLDNPDIDEMLKIIVLHIMAFGKDLGRKPIQCY